MAHGKHLDLNRTIVMGILNVTPDSFSDGGQYIEREQAVLHALEMEAQGADIIDIGGQSTRPGHTPVSAEEEWSRLRGIIPLIREKCSLPISVDTYYPLVAENALSAGADIINDVSGFGNPDMLTVAARHNAGCVLMHSENIEEEQDAPTRVRDFLMRRREEMHSIGILNDRICFDVGIGFGKTNEQNLRLIASMREACGSENPILAGVSRKRVIGNSCGNISAGERDFGTVAAHTIAVFCGADIIRVHNVPAAVQAARVTDAVMGRGHSNG
jgi:dihydropteroate synthase